jgi:hypothetical protein
LLRDNTRWWIRFCSINSVHSMVSFKTSTTNRFLTSTASSTSIIITELTFRNELECSTWHISNTRTWLYMLLKTTKIKSWTTVITPTDGIYMAPATFDTSWLRTITHFSKYSYKCYFLFYGNITQHLFYSSKLYQQSNWQL